MPLPKELKVKRAGQNIGGLYFLQNSDKKPKTDEV